jgi:hypothetical protein
MPRYYFHLLDESTGNLVRDSAGASLRSASEAKREAIGLAQDIIRHGLRGSAWHIVVTDANTDVVLRVPLGGVRPRKIQVAFDRARRVARRIALYEPRLRPHIFTWLLMAVVLSLILQSLMLSVALQHTADLTETPRVCRTC